MLIAQIFAVVTVRGYAEPDIRLTIPIFIVVPTLLAVARKIAHFVPLETVSAQTLASIIIQIRNAVVVGQISAIAQRRALFHAQRVH